MRLVILLMLVLALTLPLAATAQGAERTSCPNGFDYYPVPDDFEDFGDLGLVRILDGLTAVPPPYTVQELVALGDQIDANNDGSFCLKEISNLRGESFKNWGYFYGARDNDSAAN